MSKLKRVLIFIDWFLPRTLAGGPIRSVANMIDQLDSGFEFLIITTNRDYNSSKPYDYIIPNKWLKHNGYTKIYYFSKESLNIRNLKKLIDETEHDYVYVNVIYSFFFSILPLTLCEKTKIIASRGMLSSQAFSVKRFKKKIFLQVAKILGLYKKLCLSGY